MKMFRIRSARHPLLSTILSLYSSAFPAGERRTTDAFLKMLTVVQMRLMVVTDIGKFIGIMIYWQFQDFIFLEHMAISPELRGHGYGRRIMQELMDKSHHQIVLEVEHPTEQNSKRRIRFYEGLGFIKIPHPYFQPPYERNGQPLPMVLMALIPFNDMTALNETLRLIREEIYERFYS